MIHPTAIIDPDARLGRDVRVGPYSVIGAGVEIGDGTDIASHVVIEGPTSIGKQNKIYQFASLGADPQDKKYAGEPTRLEIGDRNTIREFVTFNRGTVQDGGVTRIGNDNWIMAYVHLAHDVSIANHCILANNASLAGHASMDDYAILGGFTLVHQFCRIGAHAFTAFSTRVHKDIPPYVMAHGEEGTARGLNFEGLKRRGFSKEAVSALKKCYMSLYGRKKLPLDEALQFMQPFADEFSEVQYFAEFIKGTERGITR